MNTPNLRLPVDDSGDTTLSVYDYSSFGVGYIAAQKPGVPVTIQFNLFVFNHWIAWYPKGIFKGALK